MITRPWVCNETNKNFNDFITHLTEFFSDYAVDELTQKEFQNIANLCHQTLLFISAPKMPRSKEADGDVRLANLSGALKVQIFTAMAKIITKLNELGAGDSLIALEKKYSLVIEKLMLFQVTCQKVDIAAQMRESSEKLTRMRIKIKFEKELEELIKKIEIHYNIKVAQELYKKENHPLFSEEQKVSNETETQDLQILLAEGAKKHLFGLLATIQNIYNIKVDLLGKEMEEFEVASAVDEVEMENSFSAQIPHFLMESSSKEEEKNEQARKGCLPLTINVDDILQSMLNQALVVALNEKDVSENIQKLASPITGKKITEAQKDYSDQLLAEKNERISAFNSQSFFARALQSSTKAMVTGFTLGSVGLSYLGLTYLSEYLGTELDRLMHADETGFTHQFAIAGLFVLSGVTLGGYALAKGRQKPLASQMEINLIEDKPVTEKSLLLGKK